MMKLNKYFLSSNTILTTLFILFTLFSVTTNASDRGTVVPGGNVSGVFNLSSSPYYIDGDITIPDQQTLTIDAGVEVIFNSSYKLTVRGRLLANGTVTDTIRFKPLNNSFRWRGIRFEDIIISNDTSRLNYCKISGSQASDGLPGISAFDNGGGLFIKNSSKIIISNSLITDNIADNNGGGIYITNSKTFLRNNKVTYNTAVNDAGGLYLTQANGAYIQNNKIEFNTAANAGGIMLDAAGSLVFSNNVIGFNYAALKGGGLFFANGTNGKYSNNTIGRNKCPGMGDGMYFSASSPDIYNSIVWFNEEGSGANIYINNDGAIPDFYYSNIQNGSASFAGPSGWTYNGNYVNNVDYTPSFWGFGADYFDIFFNSPVINRGTTDTINLKLPLRDIMGRPRLFNNNRIDIGAYEFQGNQIMNVLSGNLSGTLTTGGTPYYIGGNITVPEGQTLIIEGGTQFYFLGHFSITVRGTLIADGASNGILFTSLDTMDFCKTTLNNGGWNRIIIESTSTGSSFSFCEFQFSKAVLTTDIYPQTGGCILINNSSVNFHNCNFFHSVALNGGAIAFRNSVKGLVENCEFDECFTLYSGKGGALYIENASPDVFGCLFTSNSACDKNNNFIGNNTPLHTNNNMGGVVYISNSESRFINNTMVKNQAEKGGAFYIYEEAAITLKNKLKFYNNIIWDNEASAPSNGDQLYINSPTNDILMSNNDIQGGINAIVIEGSVPFNGTYQNNLDTDPKFTYS